MSAFKPSIGRERKRERGWVRETGRSDRYRDRDTEKWGKEKDQEQKMLAQLSINSIRRLSLIWQQPNTLFKKIKNDL